MPEIQYVSDETGNPTAVIVPIELWREIEAEKETAYLLKSENMKRRLLEARNVRPEFHSRKLVRSLEFNLTMIKRTLTIALTLAGLLVTLSFSQDREPGEKPPLLTFEDLKKNDGIEGQFRIEGYVIDIYKCPPCPPGAMCKPCIPDNIVITDAADEKDLSKINRVRIFTDKTKQFELKKKYSFVVKVKGQIPTGRPIENVELIAAKELPN